MKVNNNIQLILVALLSIVGTVFVLHSNGYLQHSEAEDALYVSEFSLLANTSGLAQTISAKPAGFVARCERGYLVMDAVDKVSKSLTGVVVDQKKRPVTCISN
ncbi:hypothetical protein [Parendozoicomonas sp. Alg238-R29]|uniref:hypothetical protein n=1 Tax=Parendozoicomonas sp. Alg238-R29 TaxID=2993446 RepID=UPI00248DA389|nr:hypothetical protein [Parendozoicomonas sp. Alg238-R29]